MPLRFAVTWDYRCGFACNLHEHLVAGLRAGADWEVEAIPFCQGQLHVEPGEPSVWDDPSRDSGILALQAGVAVRDHWSDRFWDVHTGLFAARHREGRRIDQWPIVADVLTAGGVDPDEVQARIDDGSALATIHAEHDRAAHEHGVFGVPTIVVGTEAAFARLMHGTEGVDASESQAIVERLVDLVAGWPDLNELKHTRTRR